MDGDGARALARRIEAGRPRSAAPLEPARSDPDDELAPPARYGIRIYRTERESFVADGRSVVLTRRVCKTLVDGGWVVSLIREELVDDSSASEEGPRVSSSEPGARGDARPRRSPMVDESRTRQTAG